MDSYYQALGYADTWLCIAQTFAGGLGIEPKLTASKAAVLPLDDPPRIHK